MIGVLKIFFKAKEKQISFLFFLILAISLPISAYFLGDERSFDERGEAWYNIDFGKDKGNNWYEMDFNKDKGDNWYEMDFDKDEGDDWYDIDFDKDERDDWYEMDFDKDEGDDWYEMDFDKDERDDSASVHWCYTNADCANKAPYEICFEGSCLKGNINNDEKIGVGDFVYFKEDFITFKQNGWSEDLQRSDINMDRRISMADYSVFVNSYRIVNGLD